MNILVLNFYEGPQHYHMEISILRNCISKKINFLSIHNFKHNYSKLSTVSNPEKYRVHYSNISNILTSIKKADLIISINLPWKMDKSGLRYLKILHMSNAKKILLFNQLLPVKGQSSFFDSITKTNFLNTFDDIYLLDSEIKTLHSVQQKKIKIREFSIDTEYYKNESKINNKSKKIKIFSGGVSNRCYNALIVAVDNNTELLIFSNSILTPYKNVKFLRIGNNFLNLKEIISSCDFTVLPIADDETNFSRGVTIMFLSMSMAKPVLIKETNYLKKYIIDNEDDFFYKSISELSQKIKSIIKMKSQLNKIGQMARKAVEKKASIDRFASKLIMDNYK